MKNFILTLTTALLIMSCTEKKSATNTHITGTVKGFSNGMLYLQKMSDTAFISVDSVKIEGNSKFQFDFDLDSPELMYLVVDRGVTKSIDNSLPIFVEEGNINVDTELKYFYANAKITGSKNHELYEQFQDINRKYTNEVLEISKEKYNAVRFNRLQDIDSITTELDKKVTRKYLHAINFALFNKNYEVAPYVALSELSNANIKYLDTIHNSMTPKVAESRYGKLLTELVSERKKIN